MMRDSGISGTKMRAHAKAGDHKSFKAGLPKSLHKHHKEISSHITEAYEDVELLEWFDTLSDDLIVQMIDEDDLTEKELRKLASFHWDNMEQV